MSQPVHAHAAAGRVQQHKFNWTWNKDKGMSIALDVGPETSTAEAAREINQFVSLCTAFFSAMSPLNTSTEGVAKK